MKQQLETERHNTRARARPSCARARRAACGAHSQSPDAKPALLGRCAGEMELQLQDVLRLWENAADEARGDHAKENADLRKQARTRPPSALSFYRPLWPNGCPVLQPKTHTRRARCAQVEALEAKLSSAEAAARSQETHLRAEMEQIMKLWDEAQRSSSEEVQSLQDRVVELKQVIEAERGNKERREARDDEYF